jgi:hypothetical protein
MSDAKTMAGSDRAGDTGARCEEVELAAARSADALRRALSNDEAAQGRLGEVLQHLSARQARTREWLALRSALREVLAALGPFRATLCAFTGPAVAPVDGGSLLRVWQSCQEGVDRVADSGGPESGLADNPHWGARVAMLRSEMEDRLGEEAWSIEGLIDLADELGLVCGCYLDLVERESGWFAGETQRLYAHLLGGLS